MFSGIGDAAPNNVAPAMQLCLLRMAETRSKARALRDAVNIGVAAFEELGESGGIGDDSIVERSPSTGRQSRLQRQPAASSNGKCPGCGTTNLYHAPNCPHKAAQAA